jgi:hypothetical protein
MGGIMNRYEATYILLSLVKDYVMKLEELEGGEKAWDQFKRKGESKEREIAHFLNDFGGRGCDASDDIATLFPKGFSIRSLNRFLDAVGEPTSDLINYLSK